MLVLVSSGRLLRKCSMAAGRSRITIPIAARRATCIESIRRRHKSRRSGPLAFPMFGRWTSIGLTGRMYVTAWRSTGGPDGEFVLLTMDLSTGQGTQVMSWAGSGEESRIAVRDSDGAVFVGWSRRSLARALLPGGGLERKKTSSRELRFRPGRQAVVELR